MNEAGARDWEGTGATVFFDTNVLVYMFDEDEPDKQTTARSVFEEAAATSKIRFSTQVVQEFYVATRKLAKPLSEAAAQAVVADLGVFSPATVDMGTILGAIDAVGRYSLSFWDGLILESAAGLGCRYVLSEDLQDGFSYRDKLTVRDPFAD